MKYNLEKMLALQVLQPKLEDLIKNATINTEDLNLEFEVDFKSLKGKYKKDITSLLWGDLKVQVEAAIACDMLSKGYVCFPIQGGWIVISPEGEEYQLGETSCTCKHYIYGGVDGPCKHLTLRDFLSTYRSRVSKIKQEKGFK